LPTIVESNNINYNIKDWIYTIPDYQHNILSSSAQHITNNTVEVQFKTSNLDTAQKSVRNAIPHIARVLEPFQYLSAFSTTEDITLLMQISDEWNPPPPPIINLYPTNPWKNNESKKSRPRKQNKSQSKGNNESDSYTTTTATTIQSTAQATVSDLHSDSAIQQISFNANNEEFNQFEQDIQDNLKISNLRLITINMKQQEMSTIYSKFSHQINFLSQSLPSIVQNIEKQQTQLLSMINEPTNINNKYIIEIQSLR
jgi:hypothetical protein